MNGLYKCLQTGCTTMVRGYFCDEHRPQYIKDLMPLVVAAEADIEVLDTEGLLYGQQEPLRRPAVVERGARDVWGWLPRMDAMSTAKVGLYGYRLLGHGRVRKEEEAA